MLLLRMSLALDVCKFETVDIASAAMCAAVIAPGAIWEPLIEPGAMLAAVIALLASLPAVMAPAVIFADVIESSGTVAAIMAYPTAAILWSGANCAKPDSPSLNQTRSR